MTHPLIRSLIRTSMTEGLIHIFSAPDGALESDETLCTTPRAEANVIYHVAPIKVDDEFRCSACGYARA
jgi:hypothetical protein